MSGITFQNYVRTPFLVEAAVITEENIEEVAGLVGTVRIKNGERYIALDRRVVPNISRAFIGWYVTRLGDNFRCYSPKVFAEQFEQMNDTMVVCFDFNKTEEFETATQEDWEAVANAVAENE